jgi:N-acetylmuramoyl-L-alanine amidase
LRRPQAYSPASSARRKAVRAFTGGAVLAVLALSSAVVLGLPGEQLNGAATAPALAEQEMQQNPSGDREAARGAVYGDPSASGTDAVQPAIEVTAHGPAAERGRDEEGYLGPTAEAEEPASDVGLEEGNPCERRPAPLPVPGSPGATEFWQAFRTPLPPAPVWNPPGGKRVGLQAGHWRVEESPPELGRLGHGASGGGKAEWEVNLDLARRAAAILEAAGVEVDVLPATVPPRYRAHVFVSVHADGDPSGSLRGYKLARAAFSATPEADDQLLAALYEAYGQATGLPRDDLHISRRMTAYYAFNSRRYCHAVAPGVPAAILESGFLTNAVDRELLLGRPDVAARGIAQGVLRYLGLGG